MTARHGSAILDALGAAVVAGMALVVLVRAAAVTGAAVRTTADVAALIDIATAQVERLRRVPAADATDTIVHTDGRSYQRQWSSTGGRGLPRQLSVTARSTHRHLTLSTQVFP